MADTSVKLFNFNIFSKSKVQLLEIIQKSLKSQKGTLTIFTPNPEQIMLARDNKEFASYLGFADILIPDGIGLKLASRLQSWKKKQTTVAERITGVDLATDLLDLAIKDASSESGVAKKQKYRLMLVGGRAYAPESSQKKIGKLDVRGVTIKWTPGYRQVAKPSINEEKLLIRQLKEERPDILFVAFGAPHQERWVVEHSELLKKSGIKVVLVVGGAFDVITGKLKRAPSIMRKLGLEWLFRLIQQPWRAKRQLVLVPFAFLVLKEFLSADH